MARHAGPHWMDHLAPVLMGLRASVREDSMTSPAELVFGAPFRLPGVLLDARFPQATDLDDFVKTLRDNLSMVVPHPVNYNVKSTGSLPHSLWTATMVLLRVDVVRRPLEPPYEGPFEVVSRTSKTCLLYTSPSPRDLSTSRMPSSA